MLTLTRICWACPDLALAGAFSIVIATSWVLTWITWDVEPDRPSNVVAVSLVV